MALAVTVWFDRVMSSTKRIPARIKAVLVTGSAVVILALLVSVVFYSKPAHLEKRGTGAGEFWISTNPASRNLGTLDNPFVCVTQPQFDRTMSNLPPNCTIHILAGTYPTHGSPTGYSLKTGQKVMGLGIDVTILKLAPNTPDNTCVIGSIGGYFGTNMEISDLTCDGNYQNQNGAAVTYCGATLFGTHNTIRRVKVVNLAKYGGNSEAWGIVLNENNIGDSTGNIIEDCEVTEFQGGKPGQGISAFSLNGYPNNPISGIVRNNRVLLRPDGYHPEVAFNNNDVHDCVYQSNYVDGATFGFYGDTGGSTNVSVVRNTFKNVIEGVSLFNVYRQKMTFSQNKILLATNSVSSEIAFNIQGTRVTNLSVIENRVSWDNAPSRGSKGYFLNINDVSGLLVTDNQVDETLSNQFWGELSTSNLIFKNNHDLNGKPYYIRLPENGGKR
jgi:hypothetical protein